MTDARLSLTILGSGTSTGIPVIGCDCPVCSSDDKRNSRSRCSALLQYGGRNILIDTATDFRQQALREKIDRVDAVLFTHAHADHIHGIDDLRVFTAGKGPEIPVYASGETLSTLRRVFGYIFDPDQSSGFIPRLCTRKTEGPFRLFDREIAPIPLQHGSYPTQGYRIGPLAYLTDCNGIPESSWPLLEGVELLVLDGLRLRPHQTHFNIAQAVEVAQRIGAKRTLLTHLSHEVEHQRLASELPQGIEPAFDGQTIVIADGIQN